MTTGQILWVAVMIGCFSFAVGLMANRIAGRLVDGRIMLTVMSILLAAGSSFGAAAYIVCYCVDFSWLKFVISFVVAFALYIGASILIGRLKAKKDEKKKKEKDFWIDFYYEEAMKEIQKNSQNRKESRKENRKSGKVINFAAEKEKRKASNGDW